MQNIHVGSDTNVRRTVELGDYGQRAESRQQLTAKVTKSPDQFGENVVEASKIV